MTLRKRLLQYAYLSRLHKPVGIMLLLWPTLWALWLAGLGKPNFFILFIFIAGVILMRSAGCVVNDIADHEFDKHVERTKERPLAAGKLSVKEAYLFAATLAFIAFSLVLFCNWFTISLAIVGAALAVIYPLLKRYTHLPQLGLGLAFSWGVPMAFAAQTNSLSLKVWFLFVTAALWPVIYDTMYAMVDRNDDIKIGIKSTAILFNTMDRLIIGLLQILFVIMLIIVGLMFNLKLPYYLSLIIVTLLFVYQQWLIRKRQRENCFYAFTNNNLVGFAIFMGILSSYIR